MVVAERPLGRTLTPADLTATGLLRSLHPAKPLGPVGTLHRPLGMQAWLFYLGSQATECCCYAAAVVRHVGKPKAHFDSA